MSLLKSVCKRIYLYNFFLLNIYIYNYKLDIMKLRKIIENVISEYLNDEKSFNGKLLYHSTDITNAINILKTGEIKTYENILKTANQNPSDWYDDPEYGKYVYVSDFLHNNNNYYGLSDLDVTFVIEEELVEELLVVEKTEIIEPSIEEKITKRGRPKSK